MTLKIVTPPEDIITLATAKSHLRIDTSDDDELITRLIKTAQQYVDGSTGWLGRALGRQTYDLTIDGFPRVIRLPLPPLIEVLSITYIDSNGNSQTLGASVYTVVDKSTEVSFIETAINQNWPTTRIVSEAVTVRYRCGYIDGLNASPEIDNIPAPIINALLMMIGHWYENREFATMGISAKALPLGAEDMLANYKVWWFA